MVSIFEKHGNILFLMIILAEGAQHILAKANLNDSWCDLPVSCSYIKHLADKKQRIRILCKNRLDRFDFKPLLLSIEASPSCWLAQVPLLSITVKSNPKENHLVNSSFQILKFADYLNNLRIIDYTFVGLKGFDATSEPIRLSDQLSISLLKFYSTLDAYDHDGRLIESCDHYARVNSSGFLFQASDFLQFEIMRPTNQKINRHPICPLFFRNADIACFKITYLVHSYFKNNLVHFEELSQDLNAKIDEVEFAELYGLNLGFDLIHPRIFARSSLIAISGQVNSIRDDLFKPFVALKTIEINPLTALAIFRRQGIDWVRNINANLKVNLKNATEFRAFRKHLKYIEFSGEREIVISNHVQFAYDQDFCLFKEFPFHQMVFVTSSGFNFIEKREFKLSCTVLWLFQHYKLHPALNRTGLDLEKFNFTACNFKHRLTLCNRSNFSAKREKGISHGQFSVLDFILLSDLLLIVSMPVLSAFGIVTNAITIYTIVNKKNEKTMNEKHYHYMSVHSSTNIIILSVQIFSLINECQYPFGLFCSSVGHIVTAQYFKIIFGEFLSSFFRLVSNFAYIGFSLNRLSRIGSDPDKVLEFFAKMSTKKFFVFTCVLSAGLSVVKALRLDINQTEPDLGYPMPFDQNPNREELHTQTKFALLLAFDLIYDIVNYMLFVLVSLILDVVMVAKLYGVIRERETKELVKSEQAKRENDESKRRVILIALFNSIINLITKIPSTITSVNDLRIYVNAPVVFYFKMRVSFHWFTFPYSMKFYCSLDKICLMFKSLGNFLYMSSLSLNLFMMKKFDKNFKAAYESLFGKKILKLKQKNESD